MGFFSWFSSCGTAGEDGPPSLIRYNDTGEDSDVKRAAAQDVARVEQDDKYFGGQD